MYKGYKKYIYALSVFFSLTFPSYSVASIPITALKNISQHYKKGKESFSLILGATALQGLIYDLRFYGNIKTNPQKHIEDVGADSLSKLVKLLFPSPGGALSPETTRPGNFGKHATPQTVAHIFNFVNLWQIKDLKIRELNSLSSETTTRLSKLSTDLSKVMEGIKNDNIQLENIRKDKGLNREQKAEKEKTFFLNLKDLKTQQISLKEEIAKLNQILRPGKEQEKKIKQTFEQQKDEILNKIKESFSCKNEKEQALASEEATQIIRFVESTLQEKETFYPKDTLLQVISGFFCAKFNPLKDISQLLNTLDEDIVDRSKSWPEIEDHFTVDDLPKIISKPSYTMEDLFFLLNAHRLQMPVPYHSCQFITNGNTSPYDRATNQILSESPTFADCTETLVRHVFNCFSFNRPKNQFDHVGLKERVIAVNPNNPYFGSFEEFYALQSPCYANNGDPLMRSCMNKVVAGLPHIRYKNNGNEARAGFLNLVRIFETLLGIKGIAIPEGSGESLISNWLVKSFNKIFEMINPDYSYDMTPQDLVIESEDSEISGTLALKISHKETKEPLFSFDIYAKYNKHNEARNLKILKQPKEKVDIEGVFDRDIDLSPNTAQESLWLLNPDTANKATSRFPLYSLFSKPLQDNLERTEAIRIVNKDYQKFMNEGEELLNSNQKLYITFLKNALKNLLQDMSWREGHIVAGISSSILDLYGYKDLKELLEQEVRGLRFPPEKVDLYKNFNNLVYCDASYNNSLNLFDVRGMPHLKELYLEKTNVNHILGDTFDHLSNLHINSSPIESLPLQSMLNLQELKAYNCKNLKSLEGLNKLENIIQLLISGSQVEEIEFGHHPILKKVIIKGKVKKISEIQNFPALKKLLIETEKLTGNISLSHLPNLESVMLKFSGKDLSIIDAPKLKAASLRSCPNLENVTIKNALMDIIEFNEECPLKTLYMGNLSHLKVFDLTPYSVLKSVTFEGNFSHLSTLGIKDLEGIEGLHNLSHLEKVYVKKEGFENIRAQLKSDKYEILEYPN